MFELSPLWPQLKTLRWRRWLVVAAIFLSSLEVVSRLAPTVVGKHFVHQPYLCSSQPSAHDQFVTSSTSRFITNGRGARGSIFHDQPFRIAILGSSTSADSLLDQDDTWAEVLRDHLGKERVHVDNYAVDGNSNKEVAFFLKTLKESGPQYDMMIFMLHWAKLESRDTARLAFPFSGQWRTPQSMFVSPSLLKRRLLHQIALEPHVKKSGQWLVARLQSLLRPESTRESSFIHPVPLATSNRRIRNSGNIRFQDVPSKLGSKKIEFIKKRVGVIVGLAQDLCRNVVILTQPVAYDERELPGVRRRWFSLYPVSMTEPIYKSNKSVAERMRNVNRLASHAAKMSGALVIDLDAYMRPKLRQREDLFIDKWHFSNAGARLAGVFLAQQLSSEIRRKR